MPNITINVGKPLNAGQKEAFQLALGNAMPTLPTKTIDNTTITIIDGLSMFRGGKKIEGAFVDVRLLKASPEDAKAQFSKKVFDLITEHFGILPAVVGINFVELPNWASNGVYR